MAARRQTLSHQKVAKPKVAKQHRPKPKVQKLLMYADCVDCKTNLEKWGPEGSIEGTLCPPCAGIRFGKDQKNRRALPIQQAVLIEQDGSRRVILLAEESASKALGGGMTATLYHTARAIRIMALRPCYDAVIRDNAINEAKVAGFLEYNEVGDRIISSLGCFDERTSESMYGGVVILGPFGESLYQAEVDKIMHL